jgi:small subunit ribosomal protein S1
MEKEPKTMEELAALYSNKIIPFKTGDIVEVKILEIKRNKILVEVAGFCLGVIPEKEFSPEMSEVKLGGKTLAYILTLENDDGNCVLSLRRADKEKVAKILEEKFTTGGVLTVKCSDANRGGLLCSFGEYEGFLPVSQLASSHYPKVASGDKDEILAKLRTLLNQNFQVKILSFEPAQNKLIFSEKAAGDIVQQEKIKSYKVGDIKEGEITGVVDFGLFVTLGDIEGLIHISEISWDRVENLKSMFKVGQKVKVKIISIENNRISLSLKRLTADPWMKEIEKYKVGEIFKGEVTRITPFGAFISLGDVDGLAHISSLGKKVKSPDEVLEVGKVYNFEILEIVPELHKLSLALVAGKISKDKVKKPARHAKGEAVADGEKK